jgi:hypothetical protein
LDILGYLGNKNQTERRKGIDRGRQQKKKSLADACDPMWQAVGNLAGAWLIDNRFDGAGGSGSGIHP